MELNDQPDPPRVRIDDAGIAFGRRPGEDALDLEMNGRRTWSFTLSDEAKQRPGGLVVNWPAPLRVRLTGVAPVVLRTRSGEVLFDQEVRFGGSDQPLDLTDEYGVALSLDKGGRMQRTFDQLDQSDIQALVLASRRVLDDLIAVGAEAYLCYGGLLGARRTGHLIGHDSDVDLAVYSRRTHPFDIIRDLRRVEAAMRDRGWSVVRMSAANFKVWVELPDGGRAGVDVFGSFHIGDNFHITGSLRGLLPVDAVVPFGEIELEGVPFPAPRDLDAFLAYTYGPGWKVPDPSFHFHHPPENLQIMSSWFRGARPDNARWQTHWNTTGAGGPHLDTVAWVQERLPARGRVVELGSGDGADAAALTAAGVNVLASDHVTASQKRLADQRKPRPDWALINLASVQRSMKRAARIGSSKRPVAILARDVVDELEPWVRPQLWRFCSMAGRAGGPTLLEFRTDRSGKFADPADLEAEITRAGGRIVERRTVKPNRLRWEVTWQ